MAFLGKGKKQDMLQLAEELGINATLNMTVPSIKIAITNSEGYEEEFVKNLYETIIANGKRLEELESAEKMRLEELERAGKNKKNNWANLKSATQIAELFDNYEDVRKVNSKPMDRLGASVPESTVAAVAEWYRYRTVACFVTGSSPVPLKTCRVGQRCTLNLSRTEASSRWCGVVVRRGGCQLRCRPRHLTMVQNYVVRRQKPSCS
ncbi:uncharacterized protein TNCV_4156611 [Trichonephila clavipes]|nr:uncharacterized protein TNCV_4156611 [Trichonephila clavipes]